VNISLDHPIFSGMNLWQIGLSLLVLLLAATLAMPQQPAADSTHLVKGDNPSKLEKALNEAAAAGYRISRAGPGRIHNSVANFLLSGNLDPLAGVGPHETSGAIITMEQVPVGSGQYQYAVIRLFARLSNWERGINEAAAQGFRVVPGYGTFAIRLGGVLGTTETLITIMEKAPGASEVAVRRSGGSPDWQFRARGKPSVSRMVTG
jgi:hypothetical protein